MPEGLHVLLVEDNPADIALTRKAFSKGSLEVDIHSVVDGVEALQYLHRQGAYSAAKRPKLILLDLNMPKKGGRDVLAEIKQTPSLRQIPVVVLTSSAADTDIVESYDLGANCYVTKPVGFREFQQVVTTVEEFWFTVAMLPPR